MSRFSAPRSVELLAPAGSPEAVTAAVQAGADAVYLGFGSHNARRNAANFTPEQFVSAVEYCHVRGVRVYLTLNTLVYDSELPDLVSQAVFASEHGADAVLVQDLGVLSALRQAVPDLPLHASTQMSVMNLDGVKAAADLGCTRAVLARELPEDQIAYICAHSPIEIEVFVHGAQCMCYSGQCYFSSVLGGRSGNRGLCAQPCRLPYHWSTEPPRPLLSLKDMCLADHLNELADMGVACLKIEGRMKRPEYVWTVTKIYAEALETGMPPSNAQWDMLESAFSREGFSDGYFRDCTGPDMFGARPEGTREPEALFAAARAAYGKETPRVPVDGECSMDAGAPISLTLEDGTHSVTVTGPVPEAARTRALTPERAVQQLIKTGGTPYYFRHLDCSAKEGLSVSAARLNALRRDGLAQLSALRCAPPARRTLPWTPRPVSEAAPSREPVLTVSLHDPEQLTPELLAYHPAVLYLPLETAWTVRERLQGIADTGTECSVILPRVLWDRELEDVRPKLEELRAAGVSSALVTNLGGIALAKRVGLTPRGDYGLQVTNRETAQVLAQMGLVSLTASFELRMNRLRSAMGELPWELLAYGRLPLMVTENCLYRSRDGHCQKNCSGHFAISDRRRAWFPVLRTYGCRNEIFNSVLLWLADKQEDLRRCGAWALRASFTTEIPEDCVEILDALRSGAPAPGSFTRGLYYREVE